jgi:hypothetical protein
LRARDAPWKDGRITRSGGRSEQKQPLIFSGSVSLSESVFGDSYFDSDSDSDPDPDYQTESHLQNFACTQRLPV